MTGTRPAPCAPALAGLAGLLIAAITMTDGHTGQAEPRIDDPTSVQVEIPASPDEVSAQIIAGMADRGGTLAERSDGRLLFKGVTPERDGYAAVYGCRSCGDPYSAYLFRLIPVSETATMVLSRHWVAVPRPDGEERRFRPQKDRDLKDIAKMLRDIAASRGGER